MTSGFSMHAMTPAMLRQRVRRRRYESYAEARADIFDYIECFYNPRRRRKMEEVKLKESNLTQPSVVSGKNPSDR